MSPESTFEPLRPVGEDIYLYKAPIQVSNPASPSLVILCTWVGGATPRRINKYLAQYREIHPTTSLLLITAGIFKTAIRPFSSIRASLKPAREAICYILNRETREKPRTIGGQRGILLHLFSHGGGNNAVQLAISFKDELDAGSIFFSNLLGIVLDCCPGDDTLQRMIKATEVSMPDTALSHLLRKTLLYPSLSLVNGLQHLRLVRAIEDLRELINDAAIFGTGPKRLYIYSKEDIMVNWENVQSHVKEARSRGYPVDQVVFDHGSHCGLVIEDANRYWTSIQRFWDGEEVSDLGPSAASRTPRKPSISRSRL
ncbi:hypothetical protein N7462_005892 [Penicillium macrosclerotiorum]|uniref:uncharacterized protein n=1 Tax=Penicillium macrosclerotiorum TaxID=303699 RepID=UPI0025475846|nr:uncharacterized protein N7462_005892 [Penicillium macrosclerotiorum]KAJ5682727.1 hypothetical protein N7462_005892 [Penicillium macrosclerotiorum]